MIKNIILDVGGVLLDYRWKDMLMEDYGLPESEAIRVGGLLFDGELWGQKLDRGWKTLDELAEDYLRLYPSDYPVLSWFLSHGELMRVPLPEIWERVAALKAQGYGIYILSNYSEDLIRIHTEGTPIWDLADGAVVSYQVHYIKPEPEIYQCLLNKYGLKAEECLFFDDRKENVEAAVREGIQARQVLGREQFAGMLDELIRRSGT